MRIFTMARLALRATRYHRLRSWLTVSAIAASLATLLVTDTLSVRQAERASRLFARFEQRYLIVFDSFTTTLQSDDLDRKQGALGRQGVVRRFDFLLTPFVDEADPIPLLLCGLPDPAPRELAALFTLVAGRLPGRGAREVMIERALAERRGWKRGDEVGLVKGKEALTVVGLFVRFPDVTTAEAYAPLEVVQQLREREGELTFALLEVAPGRRPESIAPTVQRLLPDWRVLSLAAAHARAEAAGAPVRLVARSLSSVVAALCAAVVLLTLWSTVNERRADYAVLRAMGFGARAILFEVMCQAALLGTLGIVKGTILGEGILLGIVGRVHPGIEVGWDTRTIVLLAAMMMAIVLGGAALPGLRAASAEPDSLMGPPG